MKTFPGRKIAMGWMFILLCLCLWCAACASRPKVDWNNRIGNFTHDQAVAELGPPDKSARMSDGTNVSEWFLRRGSSVSFGVGTGFYSGGSGVAVGQSVGSGVAGLYLRLTFGADGKLSKWERIRR